MNLHIEKLIDIKNKLYDWNLYSEDKLDVITSEFEKIPREEFSTFYVPFFTDDTLAENLVQIGRKYHGNTGLLCNIISSLGNMLKRYGLTATDAIFDFFVESISNKKANYYVSLFISSFPQYQTWSNKWSYLISIPNIAPKKKSIINFNVEVKNLLKKEKIPIEVKKGIIEILELYIKTEPLSDYSKREYLKTVELLNLQ
jgi:hypothetical protein